MQIRTLLSKSSRFIFGYFGPWPVGLAIALGMVAGLTPMLSFHNLVILFLLLIFKINIIAFVGSFLIFSTVGVFFDPLFHNIGLSLLNANSLESFWTTLYNSNIMRLTRFNNTIVMGSLCVSIVLFVPLFMLSHFITRRFEKQFKVFAERWQWVNKPEVKEV